MPFPFAAVIAPIVGAVSAAAGAAATAAAAVGSAVTLGAVAGTAAAVIGGTVLVGGAVVTAAAISVYNDEKREKAAAAARAQASRENERRLLAEKRENERKIKELDDKYGEKIPEDQARKLQMERQAILFDLEGNSMGLRDKGEVPDEEAASATAELDALKNKKGGLAA